MNTHDIGDKIVVWVVWSVAGVATDMATTCAVQPPTGSPSALTVARTVTGLPAGAPAAGAGVYYATYTPTMAGPHTIGFTTANGYEEHGFRVRPRRVGA